MFCELVFGKREVFGKRVNKLLRHYYMSLFFRKTALSKVMIGTITLLATFENLTWIFWMRKLTVNLRKIPCLKRKLATVSLVLYIQFWDWDRPRYNQLYGVKIDNTLMKSNSRTAEIIAILDLTRPQSSLSKALDDL